MVPRKTVFFLTGFFCSALLLCTLSCTNLFENDSVKIGNQVWMKSNLDVTVFRNGDSIAEAKTKEEWEAAIKNKQPAWCYYENDTKTGKWLGKLYNWYAVDDPRMLAPKGWRIPSNADWRIIQQFLGKSESGKKMKDTEYWSKSKKGTNESGFSAYPAGFRSPAGFDGIGRMACWWSSKPAPDAYLQDVWVIFSHADDLSEVFDSYKGKSSSGYSVRCIRE